MSRFSGFVLACAMLVACGGDSDSAYDRVIDSSIATAALRCECYVERGWGASEAECRELMSGEPSATLRQCEQDALVLDDTGAEYLGCVEDAQSEFRNCLVQYQDCSDLSTSEACEFDVTRKVGTCWDLLSDQVRIAFVLCRSS